MVDRLTNPIRFALLAQFLALMGGVCNAVRANASENRAEKAPEPVKTQGENGPEKICPDCFSRIPSGARVCRYCRYQFWA